MKLNDIVELTSILPTNSRVGKDVIIFCDPGIDDALMLIQVFAQENIHVHAIIAGAGNVPQAVAAKNALAICELTQQHQINVFPGWRSPIDAPLDEVSTARANHGEAGLGKLTLATPSMKVAEGDGVSYCQELIKHAQSPITIISTGALTDVYKTLNGLEAKDYKNIAVISIMGGVIDYKQHGNKPSDAEIKWAEFNVIFDPTASKGLFAICEKHYIKIILATLDMTNTMTFGGEEAKELKRHSNAVALVAAQLIESVSPWYLDKYGKNNLCQPAHDIHASMCIYHPELYQGHWVSVDVDDRGSKTYGRMFLTHGEVKNVFLLQLSPQRITQLKQTYISDLERYMG